MNIAEKMKQDWEQRAQHHARFWIATEHYQNEEVFSQSGQETAQCLMTAIREVYQPTWSVLDIGCGIGRVLKPLAPYFLTLAGVDVSSTMIAQSKSWLGDYPHITTFENSGLDLREFRDASFNLVYSYVAFQHMPRPVFERYLGEINRVLLPEGYLALQIPIGPYNDVPLEDTIGIRSYTFQEISQKLHDNGLAFMNPETVDNFSTELDQTLDHRIHVVQKIRSIRPVVSVAWAQLDDPHYSSPLDLHLYEIYAENCVKLGKPQEGIQTLQSLVNRHPKHLSGWLRLTALLLEHGQVPQACDTLQALTALHPRYQEGQVILERLQNNYGNFQDNAVTTQEHHWGQTGKLITIIHHSGSLQ